MHIPVNPAWLRSQNYDAALREACDKLSQQGIRNYIHYQTPRLVELLDQAVLLEPGIDHVNGMVILTAVTDCGYQSSTALCPDQPDHSVASH